jgi:tRNA pseudouridine38-40 synthase
MNNYKLVLQYDGTKYSGWQMNKNAANTLEEKLEVLLAKLIEEEVELIGSGRTDKGVHARGQVANFRTTKNLNCDRLQKEMNHFLPEDIAVLSVEQVAHEFHSRLHAKSKCYRYAIYKSINGTKPVFERKYVTVLEQELDLYKMQKGIELLIGTHDFKGFCSDKTKKSTVRTIHSIDIVEVDDYIFFDFIGDGFLHHMIRILMGTLIEIGTLQRKAESILTVFDKKERSLAGYLTPPEGLCLEEVYYD